MPQDQNESTEIFDQPQQTHLRRNTGTDIELIDNFKVLGVAGHGGQSQVYKAFDPTLQRTVAIKIYQEPESQSTVTSEKSSSKQKNRWLEEAKRLASFDIDGIATVLSAHPSGWAKVGNSEYEVAYIVLEWIDGETFQHWLSSNRGSWVKIAKAFSILAETLSLCHAHGVIHRDIKPDNILSVATKINRDTSILRFKLIDFGLAVSTNSLVDDRSGTKSWMSPEHVQNLNNLDGRADLYSLGVMLYEALTEKQPCSFDGLNNFQFVEAILTRVPAPPTQWNASIPLELEGICLRLLQKDPNDRYQNATDLKAELDRFIAVNEVTRTAVNDRDLLTFVSSNDQSWCDTEIESARIGWTQIANADCLSEFESISMLSSNYPRWSDETQSKVDECLDWMGKQKQVGKGISLLVRTQITLGYLLGTKMNNQYDVEMLHSERGSIFRIGVLGRRVKNLRSPQVGQTEQRELFQLPANPGTDSSRVCLAFSIGANDMLHDIFKWQELVGNAASVVRYVKKSSALDPATPDQWFRLAAEIAHEIKSREEDDIYLFMDLPGTIALMAADSLGTWSGKRIHLMQFLKEKERFNDESTYLEFYGI